MSEIVTPPVELQPVPAKALSSAMRSLLGRSCFRDPIDQVDEKELLGVLAAELSVASALEMTILRKIVVFELQVRKHRRTVTTFVHMKRAQAAREILAPGWSRFMPSSTAYDPDNYHSPHRAFMSAGGATVDELSDAEAIRHAIAKLADMELDEDALLDQAYVLVLPVVESIERLIASKELMRESMLEELFRLRDRRRKAAAPVVKPVARPIEKAVEKAVEKAAANRENARKSTGPRTAAGKRAAAANALRHGLNRRGPDAQDRSRTRELSRAFVEEDPTLPLEVALGMSEALVRCEQIEAAQSRALERAITNLDHELADYPVDIVEDLARLQILPQQWSLHDYERRAVSKLRKQIRRV